MASEGGIANLQEEEQLLKEEIIRLEERKSELIKEVLHLDQVLLEKKPYITELTELLKGAAGSDLTSTMTAPSEIRSQVIDATAESAKLPTDVPAKVSAMKDALQDLETQISNASGSFAAEDGTVKRLSEEIGTLKSGIISLRNIITSVDATVVKFQENVAAADSEVRKATDTISSSSGQISTLTEPLKAVEETIDCFKTNIGKLED